MLRSRGRLALAAAAALAACGSEEQSVPVTVMTRNLYLGAAVEPLIGAISEIQAGALSPSALPPLADQAWAQVQATDVPGRAGLVAGEIAREQPDVVGLQEAALWRTGTSSPATTVYVDYLDEIVKALAAQGLSYSVAAEVSNFDGELPLSDGTLVRLTDRDAILVRAGVATSNPLVGNYAAEVPLSSASGPLGVDLAIKRGWTSVEIDRGAARFRVYETHLEVDSPSELALFQAEQAKELVQRLAGDPLPVVLLGDLNSDASGVLGPPHGSPTPTYALLRDAGLGDPWADLHPGDPGLTCCIDDPLLVQTNAFYSRIDHTLYGRGFSAEAATIVPSETTAAGVHASDHYGMVSRIVLKFPGS